MQTALLFYRGSGPAAAFIRWFTKSKFAHVAPAIVYDIYFVRYDAYWSTGVTRSREFASDLCKADDVQYLPFDEAQVNSKRAWLETTVGLRYDKPSIIIIGLTKRLPGWLHVYVSRQSEWICSLLGMVFADIETECWGLNGPPSPEDVHQIAKAKYGV